MTQPVAHRQHPSPALSAWAERDALGRRALLTEILAQVSSEALQGETLEAVLQAIVDCLARRLPVTIASIILLDDAGAHFVQEVWAGELELYPPTEFPWPVTMGAAGRCARRGEPQLIGDVECDQDYVSGNTAVKSEYLVPIRHRLRLHGVLNLESTRADFFTPEVCAVFDAVAVQVAGAIHLARVVRELEQTNRKLEQWSMSDGLTGIANRRCFDLRLQQEWRRHARERRCLALLLVDVDCFKALNDARGHLEGDECLRELARLCGAVIDDNCDLIARYGGEELALLLADCNSGEATVVAERLRRNVAARALAHPTSPIAAHVTVSVGIAVLVPEAEQSPDELVRCADLALYRAKALGRDRVCGAADDPDPPVQGAIG